jgi:4-deoxy-L-threo-5-hexosulose-uronate ketol-isomerase
MKLHYFPTPAATNTLSTEHLRETFLIGGLFRPGEVIAHYTDLDRMICGAAVPTAKHPTTIARRADVSAAPIGDATKANRRTILKYIHPEGIKSCQLVLGFTEFEPGSIWNTMPPHTHSRRTEIYLYFDLGENIAMHFMGEPQATRHLVVRDREVVLSPAWSIHCGVGTGAYRFVWAMGGDNQNFSDMDPAPIATLK